MAVLNRPSIVLALAACFLSSLAAAAEPSAEPMAGDDDPRIDPEEVIAPAVDSSDPAWVPLYKSHEDPASLDCGERRACEDYKVEASENRTGAQK